VPLEFGPLDRNVAARMKHRHLQNQLVGFATNRQTIAEKLGLYGDGENEVVGQTGRATTHGLSHCWARTSRDSSPKHLREIQGGREVLFEGVLRTVGQSTIESLLQLVVFQ